MIEPDLRDLILAQPEVLLEDREVMNALVAANERAMGANIVDLRSIAMNRLETRLDRLEDTHRSVIAAAYENLAGTNQVHRAILQMLDPLDFGTFLKTIENEVATTLRLDSIRLVLESKAEDGDPALARLSPVIHVAPPGFVADYVAAGRAVPLRPVTLRAVAEDAPPLHDRSRGQIRSEALLRLDFGPGLLPGMLAFGACDPQQFRVNQGSDLLAFMAGTFERTMRRWLS